MTSLIAFDTSGAELAVALLAGDKLDAIAEPRPRGQGEALIPLCEALMASHGLGWGDLQGIGVGIGPGNFTGIRIAVSAARGLALGCGIPAIGVSRFETTQKLAPGMDRYTVPAVRDQVYVAEVGAFDQPKIVTSVEGRAGNAAQFDGVAHIRALAEIAAQRLGEPLAPPKPLYVKPADAAPPRAAPPVLID